MIFKSSWFARGLRLSVLVGLAAAGWHAWTVWQRYNDDVDFWIREKLTYECAARLTEEQLRPYMNEFGNVNVKALCFTDRDFFVAPYELEAVRAGTMKFETSWRPTDWPGAAITGIIWAVGTILATVAALSAVAAVKWVWGNPR
jgi:hypothetical protein